MPDMTDPRVEEVRQRAIELDCPAYFPNEWEAIEARYSAGMLLKVTGSDTQKAEETLNSVINEYNELIRRVVPLLAQAKEDEIMAIREELIRSGFAECFPEFFKSVDEIALKALELYEAEDYFAARDTADQALFEYGILLIGSNAFLARLEIINRGFEDFDPENLEKADEIAELAVSRFEENKEEAKGHAEEARLRYSLYLQNSWTTFAAEHRSTSTAERENALSLRANIAVREMFREAEEIFEQAEKDFQANDFHSAGIGFIEAEVLFAIAAHEAEEKREHALRAIREAEETLERSEEKAIRAEQILEGGTR
jgi:hypothetical protein